MKVLALRVRQKQAIFKRYCEQLRDLPLSMLNGAILTGCSERQIILQDWQIIS